MTVCMLYSHFLAYLNVILALEGIVVKWKTLGLMLQLPYQELKSIDLDYPFDVKKGLTEVIRMWLEGKGSGEPPSWKKLCQALRDMSFSVMASSIERIYALG